MARPAPYKERHMRVKGKNGLDIWSSWKAGAAYLTKGTWKSRSCHSLCVPAVSTLSYFTGVAKAFCEGYTCASLLVASTASPPSPWSSVLQMLFIYLFFYWILTSIKTVRWDQFLDHRQKGWMKKEMKIHQIETWEESGYVWTTCRPTRVSCVVHSRAAQKWRHVK